MKNVILITLAILLLSVWSGCSKEINPNANMFEVGSDKLKSVKVSQSFQITGFLKNNSNQKWNISHGAGMFTYEIYDGDGNLVKQDHNILYRDDIGYLDELKPKTEYRNNGEEHRSKEYYEFKIDKPGVYKIKTRAIFWVRNGEETDKFDLSSSNLNEFEVK
ncbi:hypothetical protein [Paenibacillus sp. HB172176]|uniref:hypothetical protein n=1 Tax=Paenibacillus sp. HB172176 TaxID=2493690 RepID=UPI00143B0FE9|nr:hypothetical protein [Paenibacillus sp. HB172176]